MVQVTTEPGCRAAVGFDGDGLGERFTPWTGPGTVHEVEVLGLRAERTWELRALARCEGEQAISQSQTFTSGSLPAEPPAWEVRVLSPDRLQPGVTFIAPVTEGEAVPPVFWGLDEEGEVVWFYEEPTAATSRADPFLAVQPDGLPLVSLHDRIQRLTWGGEVFRDVSGRQNGVGSLHHDGVQTQDGALLALSQEFEDVELDGEWVSVMGDVLLELGEDGEVAWEWSSFDHLDPATMSSAADGKVQNALDWTHANAVIEVEDLYVVSFRALDQLVAIDPVDGEIAWILGRGGDFERLNGRWFDGQHAPEWHADGTLLLYDNRVGGRAHDTRAVAYQVDLDERVVRQSWSWETEFYTPKFGDVDRLDNGNVLVCAGGPDEDHQPAVVTELDGKEPVWELRVEGVSLYRATRIDWPWLRP